MGCSLRYVNVNRLVGKERPSRLVWARATPGKFRSDCASHSAARERPRRRLRLASWASAATVAARDFVDELHRDGGAQAPASSTSTLSPGVRPARHLDRRRALAREEVLSLADSGSRRLAALVVRLAAAVSLTRILGPPFRRRNGANGLSPVRLVDALSRSRPWPAVHSFGNPLGSLIVHRPYAPSVCP